MSSKAWRHLRCGSHLCADLGVNSNTCEDSGCITKNEKNKNSITNIIVVARTVLVTVRVIAIRIVRAILAVTATVTVIVIVIIEILQISAI